MKVDTMFALVYSITHYRKCPKILDTNGCMHSWCVPSPFSHIGNQEPGDEASEDGEGGKWSRGFLACCYVLAEV